MKTLDPKWYPQRSNYRSTVKINGKNKAFFGGIKGGGNNPENKAHATIQIRKKIAICQAELAEEDKKLGHYFTVLNDRNQLLIAADEAKGHFSSVKDLKNPEPIPLMQEMRDLQAQVRELEKQNNILTAQLAAVGQQYQSESLDLLTLQDAYATSKAKEAKAQGKANSIVCSFRSSTRELLIFLAENNIETTADLQQSGPVVGEYRDYWVDRISDGKCSHSTAKKNLNGARKFFEYLVQRRYILGMPPAVGGDSKWATVGVDESSKQFLTPAECRTLFKAASPRLRLIILMGLNAGYRKSDLVSLKLESIDLKTGIILRQRSKTKAAQPTKLWPLTLKLLKEHLKTLPKNSDPFAQGYEYMSKEMSDFMAKHVSQEPKRSSKAFRSTAAQQLEKLTKGKEPKTVSMFLAHGSKDQAKAYRVEDTQSLFKATDALGKVFNLKD